MAQRKKPREKPRSPTLAKVAAIVSAGPADPKVLTRVEESDGRLRITKEFPPGKVARPEGPDRAVVRKPLRCPYCGAERKLLTRTAHTSTTEYWRCGRCVDPDTCKPTAFKVLTVDT